MKYKGLGKYHIEILVNGNWVLNMFTESNKYDRLFFNLLNEYGNNEIKIRIG